MLGGVGLRRDELGCRSVARTAWLGKPVATLPTELCRRAVRFPAVRACCVQPGAALVAEGGVRGVLVLAPGTAHQVATLKPDGARSWAPMIGESAIRSKQASECEPPSGRALLLG